MRIADAELTKTKGGTKEAPKPIRDMVVLTLSVSGQDRTVRDYIVYMEDNKQMTNEKLTAISDSFGIPAKDMNDVAKWVGKMGAGVLKMDGEYEKVSYFVKPAKAEAFGAWVEPKKKFTKGEQYVKTESTDGQATFVPVEDSDLPF